VIPKGIPFLNLTGRFGNLYLNIIKEEKKMVNPNDTVVHGSSYANETINFDIPSRKTLSQYFVQAEDPHNFDPTFIL
jgi:hypothetical protein